MSYGYMEWYTISNVLLNTCLFPQQPIRVPMVPINDCSIMAAPTPTCRFTESWMFSCKITHQNVGAIINNRNSPELLMLLLRQAEEDIDEQTLPRPETQP